MHGIGGVEQRGEFHDGRDSFASAEKGTVGIRTKAECADA